MKLFREAKTVDLDLRYEDYEVGEWSLPGSNLTREQVFNSITPQLSDLLKGIKIKKNLG